MASGDTAGDIGYAYGRAGVAIRPMARTEVALSGEVGYEGLSTRGFGEPLSAANPFQANVFGSTDNLGVGKLRGQVTHAFTDRVDATLYFAGAQTDRPTRASIDVAGIGFEQGRSGQPRWLEYGLRVGFRVSPRASVDVFTDGVTSGQGGGGALVPESAETTVHTGAAFR